MKTLWPSFARLAALACWPGTLGLAHAQLPTVSITAVADAAESGPTNGLVLIRRTGSTAQALPVTYSIRGSAHNGTDYTRLPGEVIIPKGQTNAWIVIRPLDNSTEEPARSIELSLTPASTPFTLVVVPDTQIYVRYPVLDFFDAQTRWIAANKDARNIPFVLHEGDCTDLNTEPEWINFRSVMSRLDGVAPYALVPGNHDGMESAPWDTSLFNSFYPVQVVTNQPGFGGLFEPGKIDNAFYTFRGGGLDWLVLALEFGPRDEVLAWANGVVTNHPYHKAILLTHAHVYTDDKLYGMAGGQDWAPSAYGRPNDGIEVWNKFIRHHANFVFAFNGHALNDGAGRIVMVGDHGNKVYQMLANYQTYPNGGNSWLRLVEFTPLEDKFTVRTYAPYNDTYLVHPKHEFAYSNLGLFGPSNAAYQIDPARASAAIQLHDNDVDSAAPTLVQVSMVGLPPEITVQFSEPVEPVTATDLTHYSLDNGATLLKAVISADLTQVTLTCSPLVPDQTYTLAIHSVTDLARMPNPVPPGTRRTVSYHALLARDSFEDTRAGRWSVLDQGAQDRPSSWIVRNGQMEQFANIHGPHTQAVGNRLGTIAWWNTPAALAWSNYTFSASFVSFDDDGVGLIFRYRDPDNYYKLELDRERAFRKLIRMADSVESTLAVEAAGYDSGARVQLQVRVETGIVTARVNGSMLFGGPIADPEPLSTGTIGLYCWGNAGVQFDDVAVAPTDVPLPPPGTNTNTVVNPNPFVTVTLVPIDAPWKYWASDAAPGTNWMAPAFEDRDWAGPGRAVFAREDDPIPDPRNWELSLGPSTYYFRTRFLMASNTNQAQLRLRALIDDGAVVYLNGREILRLGMPAGEVDSTTPAERSVEDAAYEGPFDLQAANVVPGTNVLAVEVHQASPSGEDVVFGVELEGLLPAPTPGAVLRMELPRLLTGGQLRLSLPGQINRVYRIETSADLADWTALFTRTNLTGLPLTLEVPAGPEAQQFYRAFELP